MRDQRAVEQELLWRQAASDFTLFCRTYWKIPVPQKGARPFDFDNRPYQHEYAELLQDLEGNLLGLKARQIGLTTEAVAFAFWTAFFRDDHPWLLVSAGEDPAKRALGRVKYGYARLPAWMKERGPEVVSSSTSMLSFANDSKIESLPATAAAGRGDSVYGVIFDEAAHMQDPASVYGALEPLCYGPFIVFSTAKGMGNWFHERWLDSEYEDSEWTAVFYPWNAVPTRDQAWYDRTQKKYRGEEWLFYQEYPSTPEEAFAKSGQVAISDDLLKLQDWSSPEHRLRWDAYAREFVYMDDVEQDDVVLYVWKEPHVERDEHNRVVRHPNYVAFLDSAEGLSHGDFNAISVWDANTMEEVAAMQTRFPIEYMGEVLEAIGYWYHTALLAVERNNTGLVPITYLSKDAAYPRLLRMQAIGKRKYADRSERYGWRTDQSTKPKMVTDFTKALRAEQLTLHNVKFREEMRTYVRDGKGGYNAVEGNHDDVIIATLGAYQAILDVGEYPTIYYDAESHQATWADVLLATEGLAKLDVNRLEVPIGQKVQTKRYALPSIELTPRK